MKGSQDTDKAGCGKLRGQKNHFTKMPKPLQGLMPKTLEGESLCFNFNLVLGFKEGAKGNSSECSRGLHLCSAGVHTSSTKERMLH
jgi:hypothetical protein